MSLPESAVPLDERLPAATGVTKVLAKAGLLAGGVVAGLLLACELYTGAAFVDGWFWPWPPAWVGVILSLCLGLIGPVATFLVWRLGRRAGRSRARTLARAELVGGCVAFGALVVLLGMLFITAPF
jgi:hypothetical protein